MCVTVLAKSFLCELKENGVDTVYNLAYLQLRIISNVCLILGVLKIKLSNLIELLVKDSLVNLITINVIGARYCLGMVYRKHQGAKTKKVSNDKLVRYTTK